MKIDYDNAKNERNIKERDLSFDRVIDFDFETALFLIDDRKDYNEVRHIAVGYLDNRLHVLCFVEIKDGIRVISLRKANNREVNRYAKQKTID